MATNLVSLIVQFLTPEMIAKLASAFGLDRTLAQKAIGAAVPSLLAALAGVASKPEGSARLSNAVAQQQPGALENLRNMIGGSGQTALAESGSTLLSTLLGGNVANGLSGAIGKFAGIGEGASKSLLGALAPVALGVLGQQQRSAGLDASGLASLLASQKDNIAAAMPPGLPNLLSGAGLADALSGGVRSAAAATSAAASRAGAVSEQAAANARRAASAPRSGGANWLYWLVGLAVLAGLAWYFLARQSERPTEPSTPIATQTVPTPQNLTTVGGVDLASQLSSSIAKLRTTIEGMTDPASARAALPKLDDVTAQVEKVSALAPQLPADGKKALSALIAAAMPALNQLLDKVLAQPEVAAIAKPAIDVLRAKLEALAKS
jgi:hypothetical protein